MKVLSRLGVIAEENAIYVGKMRKQYYKFNIVGNENEE